jgi:serine protease Do
MIKEILKGFWKAFKVFIMLFFIFFVVGNFHNFKEDIDNISKKSDYQFSFLNKRYNQIIDNEKELLKQLQESIRNSENDLKLSETLTIFEMSLIRKNLKELANNTYISDLTLQKILNSDVFVSGFEGQGAGTLIKKTDKEMYILTCEHVVDDIISMNENGMKIAATIGYSKTDSSNIIVGMIVYGAEVIKYDKENDLALLKVSVVDDNLIVVNLAENEPELGDMVFSVGSPLGLLRTISKGILSHKEEGFYFSDNTITYGNSGGGLHNIKGELIGIPSNVTGYRILQKKYPSMFSQEEDNLKFVPETSLGLSIDLSRIKTFLKGVL